MTLIPPSQFHIHIRSNPLMVPLEIPHHRGRSPKIASHDAGLGKLQNAVPVGFTHILTVLVPVQVEDIMAAVAPKLTKSLTPSNRSACPAALAAGLIVTLT